MLPLDPERLASLSSDLPERKVVRFTQHYPIADSIPPESSLPVAR